MEEERESYREKEGERKIERESYLKKKAFTKCFLNFITVSMQKEQIANVH